MKTSYTCNMLHGGVLWKMNVLNMLFYKGDKSRGCDVVCIWVRGALVLVSAHHSEWVHPPLCLSCCAFSHISGTSEKVGAFPFPRQVPSQLPLTCLRRKGKGQFSPAPRLWQNRGRAVLGISGCVCEHKNEEKQSRELL